MAYDGAMKELLNVTALASNGGLPPSALLTADYDGSMNKSSWGTYQDAAAKIAAEVIGGANKSYFIGCDPAAAGCLETTIRTFGRRAFRRPVTDAEVTSFLRLNSVTPAPASGDEVAEVLLYAFLVSPSFIMLPELAQDPEGTSIKLNSYEVATRLATLIWNSVPDPTLEAAADDNLLTTPEQILEQANRMVGDRERTAPLVKAFHHAYLVRDTRWGKQPHDAAAYPLWSDAVQAAGVAEVDAFVEEVAFNNGKFSDFLLSPVGFVTKDTAPIYGLSAASYGTELTKVTLDAEQRPGILSRTGFLSAFSAFGTSNIILRGAFIIGHIQGIDPGQPTPGAADTPIPDGEYTTFRQAVEALIATGAPCTECHTNFVNPAGYVMEKYNSIGEWQTVDRWGGDIDGTGEVLFQKAKGDVPEIRKLISSPKELMTEIANGPTARHHYAEQWVSFATKRIPNGNDACTVEKLDASLNTDGYTILNLLADLTQADSFRLRTVGN
jgi:hypothetical protein